MKRQTCVLIMACLTASAAAETSSDEYSRAARFLAVTDAEYLARLPPRVDVYETYRNNDSSEEYWHILFWDADIQFEHGVSALPNGRLDERPSPGLHHVESARGRWLHVSARDTTAAGWGGMLSSQRYDHMIESALSANWRHPFDGETLSEAVSRNGFCVLKSDDSSIVWACPPAMGNTADGALGGQVAPAVVIAECRREFGWRPVSEKFCTLVERATTSTAEVPGQLLLGQSRYKVIFERSWSDWAQLAGVWVPRKRASTTYWFGEKKVLWEMEVRCTAEVATVVPDGWEFDLLPPSRFGDCGVLRDLDTGQANYYEPGPRDPSRARSAEYVRQASERVRERYGSVVADKSWSATVRFALFTSCLAACAGVVFLIRPRRCS